ncbi:11207_t:CDS:2 [Ambispora gerdemannii]|uniref:11207_t:CDS:1 n=1 Tax=Ambispora gerdemannii TaxID=144530 RepID=A0A9N8W6H1_9GLOM|nr:11207_t:CDS:2 [Ambispora gerdemannii]
MTKNEDLTSGTFGEYSKEELKKVECVECKQFKNLDNCEYDYATNKYTCKDCVERMKLEQEQAEEKARQEAINKMGDKNKILKDFDCYNCKVQFDNNDLAENNFIVGVDDNASELKKEGGTYLDQRQPFYTAILQVKGGKHKNCPIRPNCDGMPWKLNHKAEKNNMVEEIKPDEIRDAVKVVETKPKRKTKARQLRGKIQHQEKSKEKENIKEIPPIVSGKQKEAKEPTKASGKAKKERKKYTPKEFSVIGEINDIKKKILYENPEKQ